MKVRKRMGIIRVINIVLMILVFGIATGKLKIEGVESWMDLFTLKFLSKW